MLTHTGIQHCNTLCQIPISHFPHKTHISVFSNQFAPQKLLPIHGQIRTGFGVFASKSPRKGGISPLKMEEFDFDDEFEKEEYEEEDSEDEEFVIPLRNMKKWVDNRPRGFGEGKVYDTTIEDKLVEEMEQNRLAQVANLNKLKSSPEEIISKKEKVTEAVPNGIRVRLVNLPKKKNIHRDLQAAFKGVPGIINIIPAVSGNKKTREPVCKGFAFVDFKSKDQANRFVGIYSRQTIAFGKIEKQINCDIVNSSPPISAHEQSVNRTNYPPIADPRLEGNSNPVSHGIRNNTSIDSLEDTTSDEYKSGDDDDDNLSTVEDKNEEIVGTITSLEKEFVTSSQSSKNPKKVKEKGEKIVAKRKEEKTPKLNIPGSANRLKIKEKSLLTGAFSKYGVKSALAAKGQS